MNYFLNVKSNPENPCYDPVTHPSPHDLFKESKLILHLEFASGLRFWRRIIDSALINSQCERTPSPWELNKIIFDTSLSCFKKDQTSETVFEKEYQQLRRRYTSYFEAYTHRSKCEKKVAAATFYPKDPDNSGAFRLIDGSSVVNAELEGIHLALKKFLTLTKTNKKSIIYTHSFPVVESWLGKTFRSKNIKRFYNLSEKITTTNPNNHVGIIGNERADRLAKAVLSLTLAPFAHVCWSDLKSKANMYIGTIWNSGTMKPEQTL